MLDSTPLWIFTSQLSLTQWYGYVHLLPEHAVGQWFCCDRLTGQLLWQTTFPRANTLRGVDSGVIVASEMRSDGPWTADFGCYGISLSDGSLLWTAHRSGWSNWLVQWLDLVPGFTNELRDSPAVVTRGEVVCTSGRVLDIRTGQQLRRISRAAVQALPMPQQRGWEFYRSPLSIDLPRVEFAPGCWLAHLPGEHPAANGILSISAKNAAGETLWTFSTAALGGYIAGNFYSYRIAPPFLYLVLSDQPLHRTDSRNQQHPDRQLRNWQLITVALVTGNVVQRIPLGTEPQELCRIEDLDDSGLLISTSSRSLMYFSRRV